MPTPIETALLFEGEVRPLTFITGLNANGASLTALCQNPVTAASLSFNNSQITVLDAPTGVAKLTFDTTAANNMVGPWLAQFTVADANNTQISPIFNFKVETPLQSPN